MIPEKIKRFNKWYQKAHAARTSVFDERKNHEEFYYNDVEATKSQFTKNQKATIDATYNIPISTKLTYAIIEQLISFITGTKPYPHIIAPTDAQSDFAVLFAQAYQGCWYESKGDRELKLAIKDAFVAGSGFIRVRRSNFFNESTFNCVIEHVPWSWLVIDPDSKKEDFSDAEYIFISRSMLVSQAEKTYDIDIKQDLYEGNTGNVITDDENYADFYETDGRSRDQKYVTIRELYYKDEVNLYISDEGDISLKKPKIVQIPNRMKEELRAKIEEALSELQSMEQEGMDMGQGMIETDGMEDQLVDAETFGQKTQAGKVVGQGVNELASTSADLANEIEKMRIEYYQMPDMVRGFQMEIEDRTLDKDLPARERKEIKEVENVTKVVKKRIRYSLLVGNNEIESDVLETDKYPIHHICFQHNLSPNKTYGTVHYVKDFVKAQNKFWSMLIYDMQVNNNRRVLYARGTIADKAQVEKHWRLPNAWIEYIPNPGLPNAGQPVVQEPSPLSQATVYVIDAMKNLVEYVTGIFGVMQGDNSQAPSTATGTTSLQNFGSQRPKLYARSLEYSLQDLAYSTVKFLQMYAPRDKTLMYFDMDGDEQELEILSDVEDTQFKVRVEISNSLPTHRAMYAQLLGVVAGQTKNPYVADHLTKTFLKMLDMPESRQLAEDIDMIKQMEQQLQQAQQALDAEQKKNKSLENNLYQKGLSNKVDVDAANAKKDVAVEKQKAIDAIAPEEDNSSSMMF